MKRKLTISVVALIIVVSSALIVRHNRNFKLGRPAQAAFLELLESDPIITLSECPGPQPSSEFFELLPKAIGRVKLSFDSDRTENRWACACAFWIMIDQESASAIVDQHHLLVGEKYHHLKWDGDDLFELTKLWCPVNEQGSGDAFSAEYESSTKANGDSE